MKKSAGWFVFLFLLYSVLFSPQFLSSAWAVPAYSELEQAQQPTGEALAIIQRGDEWFNWVESSAGDVLVRDKQGFWTYGLVKNGGIVSSKFRFAIDEKPKEALHAAMIPELRRKKQLSSSQAPLSMPLAKPVVSNQNQKLLIILVNFSNAAIKNTDDAVKNLFFGASGGSLNNYYREISNGAFQFSPAEETVGTLNDGVIRVKLNYSHPSDGSKMTNSQKIVADALRAADPYINFAAFDTNKNGYLSTDELHIAVIAAGYEASISGQLTPSLWAHRWALSTSLSLDGVSVCNGAYSGGYTLQGEIHKDHTLTIGVLSHELGHDLGLPDLYDIDNSSEGIGFHSLMASGSWGSDGGYPGSTPTHPDAWSKIDLGFAQPTLLAQAGTYDVCAAATKQYNILKIPTSNAKEYFLVENRQKLGFDAGLGRWSIPYGGVAIWHINEQVIETNRKNNQVNNNEYSKGVDLEEANQGILGYSQLDISRLTGAELAHYYNRKTNQTFGPATTPNSNLQNGAATGITLSVPGESALTMQVTATFPSNDQTPPLLLSVTPALNETSAAVDQPIVFTFNEPVQDGSAISSLRFQTASGTPVPFRWSCSGSSLTLTPTSPLTGATTYAITLPAKGVKDMAGNELAAPYAHTFTTASSDSAPALEVIGSIPVHGALRINPKQSVGLFFSENIQAGSTFDQISWRGSDGSTISFTPTIFYSLLILQPKTPMSKNVTYTVNLPVQAVKGTSGKDLSADFSLNFTTSATGRVKKVSVDQIRQFQTRFQSQ